MVLMGGTGAGEVAEGCDRSIIRESGLRPGVSPMNDNRARLKGSFQIARVFCIALSG